MTLLSQSESRNLRSQRRSDRNRRSAQTARRSRRLKRLAPITRSQDQPKLDQSRLRDSDQGSMMHSQSLLPATAQDPTLSVTPHQLMEASSTATGDSILLQEPTFIIQHEPMEASSIPTGDSIQPHQPTPLSKHGIHVMDTIFRTLIEREQFVSDEVLNRHSISAVIDSMAECEVGSIYEPQRALDSYPHTLEVVSNYATRFGRAEV